MPNQRYWSSRENRLALLGAVIIFTLFTALSELYIDHRNNEIQLEYTRDSLAFAAKIRSQVESELNSLLYLSSGLGGYLVVRNDRLQAAEVQNILGVLHHSSAHIRNFGVAVGYTLRYVYPIKGNEAAIGLHYPDLPEQWPAVKKTIDSRTPSLVGPVKLVQGGYGLIYRVPLYIEDRYWGLLSTVIDLHSFTKVIANGVDTRQFEIAIRSMDESAMILGKAALFDAPDIVTQEIRVPGSSWQLAVRTLPAQSYGRSEFSYLRFLLLFAATVAGWMTFMLIRSRFDLATLALYDQLTGLPNRHLLEDRAAMLLARQKRNPALQAALLFFDLDGFKDINDRYGHKAGDAVLLTVARRVRKILRPNDTVARWGGDEFVVLLDYANSSALEQLISRLKVEIEAPIPFEGETLRIGVSIGYAISSATCDFEQLLKAADTEMYQEKKRRKSG